MKNEILETLEEHLKKQRYPYLWEVELFSMLENDSKSKFVNFVKSGCKGQPLAAITAPQHTSLKKSDADIIKFITEINQEKEQVCVVIAHANYNPADLQAVYVLDCNDGEEDECYRNIVERWKKCSELYFCNMKANYIKQVIIN